MNSANLSSSSSRPLPASETGELSADEEIELASDIKLSSLILVWSTLRLHDGSGNGLDIADADLEYGESSMGVTLMREEGESKD